ncbi:hypothetical protein XHC_1450 [Xanthomonas hortorum pv. carotae str. M081]|nr:hypothetical protein XHC_1450 [Xanthomonas hortorum pv. carotae str. M081]
MSAGSEENRRSRAYVPANVVRSPPADSRIPIPVTQTAARRRPFGSGRNNLPV